MHSRVLAVLEDLIAIPSVNPALHPDGTGEAAVAAYVEDFCRRLGLSVRRQNVLPGRDNLIIQLAAGREHTLLFESHLDTVPAGGMPEAFTPRYENGRLYGRGTCDTKATLAGMLAALEAATLQPDALSCNLMLCCTVDEEHGAHGINAFVDEAQRIDGAVVGEPTEMRVVCAHKGVARFKVQTRGIASHSSMPEQGQSAILRMARVLDFIRNEYLPDLEKQTHPLCGRPTLAIGTIHGGSAINIVPDHCEIQVDRRLIPGEDAAITLNNFEDGLRRYLGADWDETAVTPLLLDPALNTSPQTAIVLAAQEVAAELGLNPAGAGVPYGSDASKLQARRGIPTIVFGPGSIAQAHTDSEFVPVQEVETAARFYVQLTRTFGQQPGGWPS